MTSPDPVEMMLIREEAKRHAESLRHEWLVLFGYAISEEAAAEMMGEGSTPPSKSWKPTRDRLSRVLGPVCAKCGVRWGTRALKPCTARRGVDGDAFAEDDLGLLGVDDEVGPARTRAERRRKDRLKSKLGITAQFEGSSLQSLLKQAKQQDAGVGQAATRAVQRSHEDDTASAHA